MSRDYLRIPTLALLPFLAVASVKAAWDFLFRIWVESNITIYADGFNYPAIGRGILNGLTLYQDILETKPPGMFLLGAASLLLTGDERLAAWLSILVLIALPIVFVALALRETRSAHWSTYLTALGVAIILGSSLAEYEAERAGGFMPEPFGVLAACLYVLTIAWDWSRISPFRTVFSAGCLLAAFGLKEPFAFTTLAAAILLAPNFRFFLRSFVLPFVLALAGGVIALLLFGYLQSYLTIFLPLMLNDRLQADYPLFFRGLFVTYVLTDLTWFSPVGPVGYSIFSIWALNPLLKSPNSWWLWRILATTALVGAIVFINSSSLYWDFVNRLHEDGYIFLLSNHSFRVLAFKYSGKAFACISVFGVLFWFSRHLFLKTIAVVIAAYSVVFAIGAGNFFVSHYLFAIPVYLAALTVFAKGMVTRGEDILGKLLIIFVIIVTIPLPFLRTPPDRNKQIQKNIERMDLLENAKVTAAQVDLLLDRCYWDRYLNLGSVNPAFTRHSPWNMGWETRRALEKGTFNPVLRDRFFARLHQTPIVFLTNPHYELAGVDQDPEVRSYLREHFTLESPPCAEGISFNADVVPYFRQEEA